MAVLTQPTTEEFLTAFAIGGAGGRFGDWDLESIDANDGSVLPLPTMEFDYLVEQMNDAGLDENNLTAAQVLTATRAYVFGLAFQLLQLSEMSKGPISNERDGGIVQPWFDSRVNQWFRSADAAYIELGITTSRYAWEPTIGLSFGTQERFPLRGSDAITSPYTN